MAKKSLADFPRSGQPVIVVPPLPTEAQIQQLHQHIRERDELIRRQREHAANRPTISSKPWHFADITGRRSGKLTAKQFERIEITATGRIKQLWLCDCVCGRTRIVANTDLLAGGKFTSCERCAVADQKLRGWKRRQARVQARAARARMRQP